MKVSNRCYLKDQANKGTLTLCLGAGVTSAIVGTWQELLNELTAMRCYSKLKSCKDQSVHCYEEMRHLIWERGESLRQVADTLEQAEYLMFDPTDNAVPVGTSEDELYREIAFATQVQGAIQQIQARNCGTTPLPSFFMRQTDDKFKTLFDVVSFCLNPKCKELITYNFDTVLEELLANKDVCHYCNGEPRGIEVFSIHHNTEPIPELSCSGPNPLRIYHVHGVLNKRIKTQPIIFSESSYLRYQRAALNWSNLRVADVLTRSVLLCVGFSGSDPNFRMLCRLLKENRSNPLWEGSSQNECFQEYPRIFLTRCCLKYKKGLDTKCSDLDRAYFITCLRAIRSYYLNQFHMEVIWTANYSQQISFLLS